MSDEHYKKTEDTETKAKRHNIVEAEEAIKKANNCKYEI